VNDGGAAEAVHHLEADREFVEHRSKQTSHGAFLAHHHDADRLLIPEIPTIGLGDTAGVLGGVSPCRDLFKLACLVDDPPPRDDPPLARLLEQAVALVVV
jgi:hypothetical protein